MIFSHSFLNDLDRIASWEYSVTDDDIVRARLKTVGIQEHRLIFKDGPFDSPLRMFFHLFFTHLSILLADDKQNGWEWRIFDVGGCRTLVWISYILMIAPADIHQRSAWQPYFENVNVIIFCMFFILFFQRIKFDKRVFRLSVSPVSVFDQRLEEDSSVNRLEDSITLWTSICSSKLLAKTQLILFLNKCDLLRRKLKRGIKVKKYIPNFGDQPNEVMTVVKCKSFKTFDELDDETIHFKISAEYLEIFKNIPHLKSDLSTSTRQP